MRVTILGAGSSGGVPVVGVGWGKCDPKNPKNRRTRPSIIVETANTRVLVDTSPDLREQLLNADVTHLDAVLFTHSHADHLHGIDEIRGINQAMQADLQAYTDKATFDTIRQRFGYTLEPLAKDAAHYYKPCLIENQIKDGDVFQIGDMTVTAWDQDHGYSRTLGFRFNDIAYTTDLIDMSDAAFDHVAGVKLWIIGTFTDKEHWTHAHVDKALKWIERIKPEKAILTHLGPRLDYSTLQTQLPEGVEAAYDMMTYKL